jgi:hypothetical protein
MPYEIEWEQHGAIKHFAGEIAGSDLLESEQRIASHPNFTSLRYVISVYLDAKKMAASIEERRHLRAIRIGSHASNPRIRFAFATTDPLIKRNIESSVDEGEALHEMRVFDTLHAAVGWATSPD